MFGLFFLWIYNTKSRSIGHYSDGPWTWNGPFLRPRSLIRSAQPPPDTAAAR